MQSTVITLLAGIERRFENIFEDSCSAVIHLKFKTSWTDNGAIIDSGIQHVQQLLSAATEVHSAELAAASQLRNDDIDADFFIQRRAQQQPVWTSSRSICKPSLTMLRAFLCR